LFAVATLLLTSGFILYVSTGYTRRGNTLPARLPPPAHRRPTRYVCVVSILPSYPFGCVCVVCLGARGGRGPVQRAGIAGATATAFCTWILFTALPSSVLGSSSPRCSLLQLGPNRTATFMGALVVPWWVPW
jgi:hypothetical protein